MKRIKDFYWDMFASHYQSLRKRGVYDAAYDVILSLTLTITLNISTIILLLIYILSIKIQGVEKIYFSIIFLLIGLIVFGLIHKWYYRGNNEEGRKRILKRNVKHRNILYVIYKIASRIFGWIGCLSGIIDINYHDNR